MKYREFGKNGFRISEIGFGGWALGGSHWGEQDDDESLKALSFAVDRGVNIIDTAAAYGRSEEVIGKFLKQRKEKIYVSTKIPPLDGPWPPSPYCKMEDRYPEDYIRKNTEERLSNLGVDCIDILLLHTWSRAWNHDPKPLKVLQQLKKEGKIKCVGVATPEHDQNSLVDIMKKGYIDAVLVVYNIFDQEPAAEFLPIAKKHGVGVIARAPFDEGSLTGRYDENTTFEDGDFRNDYFSGDRLSRTLKRVEKFKEDIKDTGMTLAEATLLFILENQAVNCVIPGMRNVQEVEWNIKVPDMPKLSEDLVVKLRKHNWQKAFWYLG